MWSSSYNWVIKVLISFRLVESLRIWEKSEQGVGGIFDITDYMIGRVVDVMRAFLFLHQTVLCYFEYHDRHQIPLGALCCPELLQKWDTYPTDSVKK